MPGGISRRAFLTGAGLVTLGAIGAGCTPAPVQAVSRVAGLPAAAAPAEDGITPSFTIAVIPDSQYSMLHRTATFARQTGWLAENAARLNLRFVLHEGDVVQTSCNRAEWALASKGTETLERAGIPYAIAPGNHDLIHYGGCGSTGWDDSHYNATFGLNRIGRQRTFGGSFDSTANNTYSTFEVGSLKFLVLALQFGPTAAHLDWAREVAAAHPEHHAILVTHDMVGPDGIPRGAPDAGSTAALPSLPGQFDGQAIWDRLVRTSPTVQLTLNGHVSRCAPLVGCGSPDNPTGVAGRSVGTNDAGLPVHRMLANYQNLVYRRGALMGDGGFIRLLTFYPDTSTIYVRTYSPTFDAHLTDARNQFFLTGVTLHPEGPTHPVEEPPTQPFPDTLRSAFVTEITAMRAVGVVQGYPDGTFRPAASITRGAAAVMIHRATLGADLEEPTTCAARGVRSPYRDVPDNHPFSWAIYTLSREGRISGWPDGTFRPSALVSRSAFAAFMFSREPSGARTTGFSDVPISHRLAHAIVRARRAGVVNGYTDGTFRPSQTINRQAAAAMLARYYYLQR